MKKIALIYLLKICFLYSQEIVSMTLTGDEILVSLGLKESIVGVSGRVVDDPRYSNIVGKLNGIPRVEGNLENILYLKPDIVIVGSWISKDKVEQLEKRGVKILKYRSVNSFSELKKLIEYFGKALNAKEKSRENIEKLEKEIEKVRNKGMEVKNKKRVLFYSDFGVVFGKNTIFDDISKIGNFINIAAEDNLNGMATISEEKIVEYDPDVLLLLSHADRNGESIKKVMKNRGLKNVKAIKNSEVYSVESKTIMNSSPYMIDSIDEIFRKVYENEKK